MTANTNKTHKGGFYVMRVDEITLHQARTADVLAFFEKYNGFTFAHHRGAYRCKQHPSLAIKDDRLSWYWHSKGVGGFGVLDYLTKVENMPFRDAVDVVIGVAPTAAAPITERGNKTELPTEKPKTLVLPEKTGIPLRLYDYLCNKRSIDGDIVRQSRVKIPLNKDKRRNM
jgi:hypothetical protein